MTANHSSDKTTQIPESLFEEAASWYVRLREPQAQSEAALQADFKRWLIADPRHRQAYEETEKLWTQLEAPATRILEEEPTDRHTTSPISNQARRSRKIPALAAGLFLTLGASLLWQTGMLSGSGSDHQTATGERMPVVLEDGTQIRLNTNTSLAVSTMDNPRHVRMTRGQAWFEVASDAENPFLVETPSGTIRVTGTRFDVRIENDNTLVSLVEGKVELIPQAPDAKPDAIILTPGEQARISAQDGITAIAGFDQTTVTAWQHGQLVFYDSPLSQVIDELNRYRPGTIVIASESLEQLKVSGVFSTDDPEAALSIITNTLNVKITRFTGYLVFLHG